MRTDTKVGDQNQQQPPQRVLLIEIVTHERWVFESRLFPFIQGYARERGARTRWLCFGEQIRTEKTSAAKIEQYVELGDDDLATLEGHVRDVAPTHVVINQPLSPRVLATLRSITAESYLEEDALVSHTLLEIHDVAK